MDRKEYTDPQRQTSGTNSFLHFHEYHVGSQRPKKDHFTSIVVLSKQTNSNDWSSNNYSNKQRSLMHASVDVTLKLFLSSWYCK
eukprot:m.290808 g.290808  ORF g.290808 m.290808 type:complete len:84 (-) comp214879_c0_seq1:109-360(-)